METRESSSVVPDLISVAEAASRLGLAKRTVYLLVAEGQLGACRIGKRVLVPQADIGPFIDRCRVPRTTFEPPGGGTAR